MLSLSSIIILTYLAFWLPFLILEIILALEVAVIAVSEPDKNPEIKINKIITISNNKFRNVIGVLI